MRGISKGVPLNEQPAVLELCLYIRSKSAYCISALSLLADIYVERGTLESKKEAAELFEELAKKDVVHEKYWTWKRCELE